MGPLSVNETGQGIARKRAYAILTQSMEAIETALPYIQIALSILLVIAVLLQQTGAGVGGAFGGDNFSAGHSTRRGFEKRLFQATIALGVLLALSAFLALIF